VAAGRERGSRPRRVSLPGVAELLRPVGPGPASDPGRQASGREAHPQKITVYLSADEFLDLERARLSLHIRGIRVDRGRLVREAIAVLMADLEAGIDASVIARRLRAVGQSIPADAVPADAVPADAAPAAGVPADGVQATGAAMDTGSANSVLASGARADGARADGARADGVAALGASVTGATVDSVPADDAYGAAVNGTAVNGAAVTSTGVGGGPAGPQ
jgi:hypothetical protein